MSAATALSAGDTAWVLVSAALVMLMLPGLALFYGGLVRGKNSLNTLMMTVAALGVVTIQWVGVGYSLAFSPGSPVSGGFSWSGFAGVHGDANPTYAATIPHLAFAAFQAMFAAITVALVSGAVVERMRFRAYLLFVLLWTTVPPAKSRAPSCPSQPAGSVSAGLPAFGATAQTQWASGS